MATYSSNVTTKFTGTQVVMSVTGVAGSTSYTVPAGKTLIGGWAIMNNTGTSSVTVDSVNVGIVATNGIASAGPLRVNAGSVIALATSAVGSHASAHGVLMENTP